MRQLLQAFTTPLLTVFIATFTAILLLQKLRELRKLPPGSWGLPIVGYLPFMLRDPHLKATKLAHKFGNVFSVKLGPSNVVFLNDLNSVKDAFSKDEFLGRPDALRDTGLLQNERDLITESGSFWKEQRRFAFKTLRDLGFGKQIMESNIKDEISYFIREIEKRLDNPVNVHELLTPSVSNIICYMVFGRRYDYDDPRRQYLDIVLADVSRTLNVIAIVGLLPLVKHFLRIIGSAQLNSARKNLKKLEELIDGEIDRHKQNLEEGDAKDYMDGYLQELNEKEKRNDVASFTKNVVNANTRVFFAAGSETVRTTLDWLLKFMAVKQDIQIAVQKEVDSVIGSDRLPSWPDREFMPFTQAVILETQRWVCVVPINIPRRTMADTTVLGHFIPKDTTVIANFYAINRGPNLWKNPDEFNPYHSLQKMENYQMMNHWFHSVSVNYSCKRACVGETLAKFELFLYFTILVQKFTIEMPAGVKPSLEYQVGVTLQPVQKPILKFSER